MRLFLLSLTFCIVVTNLSAQSNRKKKQAGFSDKDYEIVCAGVGVEGTKLISVVSYGANPEEAERYAKRNAIHGIIFRGAPGSAGGCQGVKPLARDASLETDQKSYFNKFFSAGGDFAHYVALTTQGGEGRKVTRISKKAYKVEILVSVLYDQLRRKLEQDDIIKSLGHGF